MGGKRKELKITNTKDTICNSATVEFSLNIYVCAHVCLYIYVFIWQITESNNWSKCRE